MSVWAAGAVVVGAGLSAAGSASAGRSAQRGADAALDEQRRQYDTTRSDNQTALDARNSALARMQELAGTFGKAPTAEEVMATPGYEFGRKSGMDALEGSAAARGGVYSGAAIKAGARYANDYATTKYDDAVTRQRAQEGDAFDRERSIATGGQAGASTIAAAGQNAANQSSDILQGNANVQGAAAITTGNTIANAVNQGVSWWNSRTAPTSYTTPSANGSYANPAGNDGYNPNTSGFSASSTYADGGPVRKPEDMLAPMLPAGRQLSDEQMRRLRVDQDAELQAWKRKQMGGIDPTARIELAEQRAVRGYAMGGMVRQRFPIKAFDSPPMATPMRPMQPMQQPAWHGPDYDTPMAPQASGNPDYDTPQPYMQPNRSRPWMAGYADGGRVEPRVGTKAPQKPGGTGGGLSDLRTPVERPATNDVGEWPANFLTKPKAILAGREERANYLSGGPAVGGPPGTDTIPAYLDNGEHVVTADEIDALGEGDNELGQMRMAHLRKRFKEMH